MKRPFGKDPTTRFLGDLQSPWLLTTYPSPTVRMILQVNCGFQPISLGFSKAVFLYLSLIQDTHSTCSWTFISCSRRSPRRATQVSSVATKPIWQRQTLHGVVSNIMLMLQKIWANKKWDVNKTLVKIYQNNWALDAKLLNMDAVYISSNSMTWRMAWVCFGALKKVLGTEILLMIQKSRRSPVEIGTSSYYLQGFSTSQVVVWDFWTINSSFPRSPVDQTKAPLSY